MKKINHNTRIYLKPNGLVLARVRWSNKTQQCYFSLGIKADPQKWSSEAQHARKNTVHIIDGESMPAREINEVIDEALSYIEEFFAQQELKKIYHPVKDDLLAYMTEKLDRPKPKREKSTSNKHSFSNIFNTFLHDAAIENNWGPKSHQKYIQVYKSLLAFENKITLSNLCKKKLLGWKEFMIEKGYHNYTINRHLRNIRTIARWAEQNGEEVNPDIFTFKTKLSAPRKTIIYLTMEEVEQFYNFQFPENRSSLAKARDLFIFMCYTSLRYSDMRALKKASMVDGFLEVTTIKTRDKIRIPLSNQAQAIFDRYANNNPGDLVFNACSNQKLNDYIKEAAKMAGLDREIVTTYYNGTRRIDEKHKLHEIISCHVGRKTFVSLSLALAIPPSVVMSITGHSDYDNMLPYICIGDNTAMDEIQKWNKKEESEEQKAKKELLLQLEKLPLNKLNKLLSQL